MSGESKRRNAAGIGMGMIAVAAVAYVAGGNMARPRGLEFATSAGVPIKIQVSGAVRKPGVYELGSNSRVQEAIDKAGGLAPGARADQLNLSAKLLDAVPLVVPDQSGDGSAATDSPYALNARPSQPLGLFSDPPSGSAGAQISLNNASKAELEELPGVGPAIAQRIIDYRSSHNGFKSVDELDNVKGIGEKTMAKLRPFIKL